MSATTTTTALFSTGDPTPFHGRRDGSVEAGSHVVAKAPKAKRVDTVFTFRDLRRAPGRG